MELLGMTSHFVSYLLSLFSEFMVLSFLN
jgi:hypothetical protein